MKPPHILSSHIQGSFGHPVRVPSPQTVIADRSNSSRHVDENARVLGTSADQTRPLLEQGGKMFGHAKGTEGIDSKRGL